MAQQTFNVQGMGNIPLFALESTAQQISAAIQGVAINTQVLASINAGTKFAGTQQQVIASMSKNVNQGIHEMHHVGIRGLNKSFLYGTNMIATSLGQKLGELTNLSKGMDRLATLFKPTASGGIFSSLIGTLGTTGGNLNLFGKLLGKFALPLQLAGVAITGILNVAEGYRKNLLDLTNYGTGFGTSILLLEQQLASAGVTIDDYALVVQEHGVAVRNLGTNAMDAAANFSNLARTVRDTAKEFGAYGLTNQELNQFTAEYLEMQRQRGVTGENAALGVEKAFRTLAIQTDAMARQTGRDRREALRAGMQAGGTKGVARRARALGAGGEAFTANVQSLAAMMTQTMGESAPALVDAMTQAAAMGSGLELTDMREQLSHMGEAGSRLNEIIRNIDQMSPEEMSRAYEDFGNQLARQRDQRDQQGQEILAMNNEAVRRYADLLVDYKNITNLAEETKKFQKKSSDTTKLASESTDEYVKGLQQLLGAYEPAMKDVEAGLKGVRAKVLDPMAGLVDDFSRGLGKLTTTLREWAVPTEMVGGKRELKDAGLLEIFKGMEANLKIIAGDMIKGTDNSKKLLAEIKAENKRKNTQGATLVP